MEPLMAEEEGEQQRPLVPSTATRRWRFTRAAVVASGAAVCTIAAVTCWRRWEESDIGGDEGPVQGLIAEFTPSFTCSGYWPEPWFAQNWEEYCSKSNQRVWAMTDSCNYAVWRWNFRSAARAERIALRRCNKGSGGPKCFVFDRNGEKCKDLGPTVSTGGVPSTVQWGPPFKGTFQVGQGPHECNPTHCDGTINEDAVDIPMPKGTEVIAGRAGVVVRMEDGHGDGTPCTNGRTHIANMVGIKAKDGTEDQYLHFLAGSFRVKKGDCVTEGQVLALSGNSGCSSGPHLHVHTLNPNGVNTVDMTFTIPCSHMEETVPKRSQVWCNDANCTCVSAFCNRATWDSTRRADWTNYCQGYNDKAWVSDVVCAKYGWWTGAPNAVALAKEHCGPTCIVRDENGQQCQ